MAKLSADTNGEWDWERTMELRFMINTPKGGGSICIQIIQNEVVASFQDGTDVTEFNFGCSPSKLKAMFSDASNVLSSYCKDIVNDDRNG